MLLLMLLVAAIVTVPLAGGDLRALGRMRFRHGWLLVLALGTQIWLIARPGPQTAFLTALELAAYPLGIGFLYANRKITGLGIVALGAAMNFAAIAANAGVMPANPDAVALAGLPMDYGGLYANSAAIADPRLAVLGDIFAVPATFPFANVYSIGDLVIVSGAAVAVHHATASGWASSKRGTLRTLMGARGLPRLCAAVALASVAAWLYPFVAAAVVATRSGAAEAAGAIGILLVVQLGSSAAAAVALVGTRAAGWALRGAGPAMAALTGALAVASLAATATPSLPHLALVAAVLGALSAVHRAAAAASASSAVRSEGGLPVVHSVANASSQLAIVVGPGLAALLLSGEGSAAGFAATSALLAGAAAVGRSVRPDPPAVADPALWGRPLRDPVVQAGAVVAVVGLVGLAWSGTLGFLLVRVSVLRGAGGSLGPDLSLLAGCLGIGLVLGSLAAPSLGRRWSRKRVLLFGLLAVGFTVLLASRTTHLSALLLAVFVGALAASTTLSAVASLVAARVPEAARGRLSALLIGASELSLLAGCALFPWLGRMFPLSTLLALGGWLVLIGAMVVLVLLPEGALERAPATRADAR